VLVPLLLITHGLVFWLLLQRNGPSASHDNQQRPKVVCNT
jgi:hypothetical protein